LTSESGYHIPHDRMTKKGGSITLEMLWEMIESIDASNKQTVARLEKIENSPAKNNQESSDRDRSEADLEAKLLKSVNDQVAVSVQAVQATTLKNMADKMEHLEFRIGQIREGSSSSSPYRSTEGYGAPKLYREGDGETLQRIKVQAPRQVFSSFNGEDLEEWIAQCEYIFEMYQIHEDQKTIQAVANFKGEANSWYRGYKSTKDHLPWPDLVELVKVRFSLSEKGDPYEERKRLVQTSTVREYLNSSSSLNQGHLPESHYITAFICGLREDIKHLVLSQHHNTLLEVFQYAQCMEAALDFQFKRIRTMIRPQATIVNSIPKVGY
jgi:Retrotransposon gag protein